MGRGWLGEEPMEGKEGRSACHPTGLVPLSTLCPGRWVPGEETEAEGSGGRAHITQGGARDGEPGALLWDPSPVEQAPGPGS